MIGENGILDKYIEEVNNTLDRVNQDLGAGAVHTALVAIVVLAVVRYTLTTSLMNDVQRVLRVFLLSADSGTGLNVAAAAAADELDRIAQREQARAVAGEDAPRPTMVITTTVGEA